VLIAPLNSHQPTYISLMLIFVKVSFGEFNKFLDYFIFICRLLYPLKILNANF